MSTTIELNYAHLAFTVVLVTGGIWIGKVNADRSSFREFMKEIRDKIDEIRALLTDNPITRGSPLRLNDIGEKISQQTSASEWARDQIVALHEKTAGLDALQIQEFAFSYARDFDYPEEMLSKLRTTAFDTGMSLDKVKQVLGLELRDVLLKAHLVEQYELDSEPES
ncbi:MAG: hypothetical protein OXN16_15065 [Gammaproteobacteria bacterium]|nr:hypothetical protein [Gammaproteobacteria bacterium]MDE0282370.1 hypothetical protein [Gammaproteobacteria bacterium]